MLCKLMSICFLNCITENIQVTDGQKYFPRGPAGQPRYRLCSYFVLPRKTKIHLNYI
jgi:hypothetical protein